MNVHGRNFVLNPVERWQTNKTMAAIHFHEKTGEGKPRYSSVLCRQKTHMVGEDGRSQAWTSQKYQENPVNALWKNSTGIAQLTCYRKVCEGCYWPAWNLLHAEHEHLKAESCVSPQSPWWPSAELAPVYWCLSCTGGQYSRCSWESAVGSLIA